MPRYAKEVLSITTPSRIWEMAVSAGRKYLLVGDGGHADARIRQSLIEAMPLLKRNGFRHLGLEQDRRGQQGPLDAFQFASASDRQTGADRAGLLDHISMAATCYTLDDRSAMLADRLAAYNLSIVARATDIRLHCLNNIMSFNDFLVADGEKEAAKFARFGAYAFRHLKAPPRITHDNMVRLDRLMGRYMDYNLACDTYRAGELQQVAGNDRAAMLYGGLHFRRPEGSSIEKHLPDDSSVFVYVGSSERVRNRIRESRKGEAGLPDFAIDTDKNCGMVLMPAAGLSCA